MPPHSEIVEALRTWQPRPGVTYSFAPAEGSDFRINLDMQDAGADALLKGEARPCDIHAALNELQSQVIQADRESRVEKRLAEAGITFEDLLRSALKDYVTETRS